MGMRVLIVGGSGYVAGLILPALEARHAIRILDRRPPRLSTVEHVAGSATDPGALREACAGVDAVLHCAMGNSASRTPEGARDSFDVNVTSVHLTLLAAHAAGVPHAVHISSLSVYRDLMARRLDESVPPDATDLYGLTKRLGEQVCRAAAAEYGLSVNILRLTWPTPDELWPVWGAGQPPELLRAADGSTVEATAASDLGAAVLSALAHRNGVQVFTISGDRSAGLWSTAKAREVLGWQPTFPR
jgi:nucleoside-diphosphate-sugar epimerase